MVGGRGKDAQHTREAQSSTARRRQAESCRLDTARKDVVEVVRMRMRMRMREQNQRGTREEPERERARASREQVSREQGGLADARCQTVTP